MAFHPPGPMRVAIFSETYRPAVNGISTRLEHTIEHLARRGDQVMLVVPGDRGGEPGGVVQAVGGFKLPLYPQLRVALPRPAIRRLITGFRPHLIHVVNPALLGVAGLYYGWRFGVRVLASFHTHLPRYLKYYRMGALERVAWGYLRGLHNRAHVNLCLSSAMERELQAAGLERTRVGWRGGVDLETFHPGRGDIATRWRLSGGDPSGPLLLYVGRLSAEKRVEELRDVVQGVPRARLAIVGDGPHRMALERHFKGTPTTFLGYLRGAELAAAYASSDIFLFPSLTETLGLVLLEAMASGLPVVAGRAGGIPEIVEDGVTGCLFEPGQAKSLLAATRRLLASESWKPAMSHQARRRAQSWTWAAAADDLRQHYRSMIDPEALPLVS